MYSVRYLVSDSLLGKDFFRQIVKQQTRQTSSSLPHAPAYSEQVTLRDFSFTQTNSSSFRPLSDFYGAL